MTTPVEFPPPAAFWDEVYRPKPSQRSGKIGALLDDIDQIRRQIQAAEDQANTAWSKLRQSSGNLADADQEAVAQVLHSRLQNEISRLTREVRFKEQQRADLVEEAKRLQGNAEKLRAFIAENEERCTRYEKAVALFDQAIALDPNDYQLREAARWGKSEIAALPDRMRQVRAELQAAEREVAELGSE